MGKEEIPTDYIWGVGPHLDDTLTIEHFMRHGENVITGKQSPTSRGANEGIHGGAPIGEAMLDALYGEAPDLARRILDESIKTHPEDPLDVRNAQKEGQA